MRVASVPRIWIPVYPTPLPASELTMTEGVWFRMKGRSWPRLDCSICFFVMSVFVKGAFSPARRALTSTGCKKSFSESGGMGLVCGGVSFVGVGVCATAVMVTQRVAAIRQSTLRVRRNIIIVVDFFML